MTTDNQRPGVYSRYDISSAYAAPRSGGYAAVVAEGPGAEGEKLYQFSGIPALREALAETCQPLRDLVEILLRAGVSRVYGVAVEGGDYPAALARVEHLDNVAAVICGGEDREAMTACKASVERSAGAARERVGYGGVAEPQEAVEAARALNSERMVLCCPAVSFGDRRGACYGAAALAGQVLGRGDSGYNFDGESLADLRDPQVLEEAVIQELLRGGVTVLEQPGSSAVCIRAFTTRTLGGDDGVDYSLRGLNAVLIIDDVMSTVRAALQARLRGTRLTTASLGAVASQVTVELEGKKDAGLLSAYDAPKVYGSGEDPTACVVEMRFQVAHVVSQIHITAHIRV